MSKINLRVAAVTLGLAIATLAPAARADLIGLYTYDNAANLGQDSSGKGNNLVAGFGTPTGVAGKFGGGIDLNNNADLVSASGVVAGLPTGGSSYTIASWINPDTAGGQGGGSGGIVGWGNYFNNSQVVAFRMYGSSGLVNYWWDNDLIVGAGSDLTTGAGSAGWHFVAATYDAATHLNAIYVDGNMVGSRYGYNLNDSGNNFAVGKTVNSEFFDGQMDNTAIFNQALTSAQLARIAQNDFSEFGVNVNAVPEPESLLLLGLGMVGLVASRRKRKA